MALKDKAAHVAYTKQWRVLHPGSRLGESTKARYGVTALQKEAMWLAQDKLCAICGKEMLLWQVANHTGDCSRIDHNHTTGQVRSLLCGGCNLLVGNLEHPLADTACEYLERWGKDE
jgi:hypothetical protein